MVYYKDRCFFLCFREILSLQHNLLHRDEFAWNLFMCTYYFEQLKFHEHGVSLYPLEKLTEH